MQRAFSIIGLAILTLVLLWSTITVRFVQTRQFCSNAMRWRVVFHAPDHRNLNLQPGVYLATSYTLANGFGFRGVSRAPMVVPPEESR